MNDSRTTCTSHSEAILCFCVEIEVRLQKTSIPFQLASVSPSNMADGRECSISSRRAF